MCSTVSCVIFLGNHHAQEESCGPCLAKTINMSSCLFHLSKGSIYCRDHDGNRCTRKGEESTIPKKKGTLEKVTDVVTGVTETVKTVSETIEDIAGAVNEMAHALHERVEPAPRPHASQRAKAASAARDTPPAKPPK